jgi:yeast amino acid transporter
MRSNPPDVATGPSSGFTPGAEEQENTALKKQITDRQFIFMAMGGSIGAGLLFASSYGLILGGPAALLLGFLIVGVSVTLTMGSLGELGSTYPVDGSFYDYSVQFISRSWGFAMGWNYIINFVLVVPFEITVMAMIVSWWNNSISHAWLIPIFIIALLVLAACGARWYGEAEHAFGILKVLMLVTFCITAIAILAGSSPAGRSEHLGFTNWAEGRAFISSGMLPVFTLAGMAYGGTEMLGLTVAECQHPEKVMPLAFKIVIVRIALCYLLPLFLLGLVLGGKENFDLAEKTSPFVVAVQIAKIPVLPHIFNTILLIAIFSMANACVFASSRALRAICAKGMGPPFLAKTTQSGLPLNALGVVFATSLMAFISVHPKGRYIFHWLMSLASASNYFTWLSINVAHIRLRRAIKKQGLDLDEVLVWKSPAGVIGSVIAILISLFGLISMPIVAAIVAPSKGEKQALVVTRALIGSIIVIVSWLGHMIITWWNNPHPLLIPLEAMDLSREAVASASKETGVAEA